MDVLFVTHHYLSGNGGGVFASRAYINAIAEIAEDVTLLYPYKKGKEIQRINTSVHSIPVYYNKSKLGKFFDLCRGHVHRFFDVFEQEIKRKHYDIVIFDNSRTSFRQIDIAHQHGARVITIHHNCEMEYVRDNYKGLLKKINLYWTEKQECEAVQKSDINLTITKQDAYTLAKRYMQGNESTFRYVGCFEYERHTRISPPTHCNDGSLGFVISGNLAAMQTEESLMRWLQDGWTTICKVVPHAQLVVAGKDPSLKLQNLCASLGIEIIPSPVDMQPILTKADVYWCPIDCGGGLKLRIMDGLKNGLPVIAHQVAARGYDDFVALGCMYVYDDLNSLIRCVNDVINNPINKEQIIDTYQRIFSFDAGIDRMKVFLTEVMK